MNTYFEHNEQISSNKRIMNAYFGESARCESRVSKAFEAVLSFLLALVRFFTSASVRNVVRVSSVAVSLVALLGVAGAIESGSLGLGLGLVLGLAIIAIEYFCLAPRRI